MHTPPLERENNPVKTNLVLIVAGLALALGLGVAWRERDEAADAMRARIRVEQSAAAVRAEHQRHEQRLALANRDVEARRLELAQLEPAPAATAANAAEPTTDAATRADPFEQVMRSDPKLQALRIAMERARLATDYAAFFRERGLTPEQIARFQEITLAKIEACADIDATIQSLGLDEEDPRIARVRGVAFADFNAAQKTLLGPDGFRQMEEFQATISLRNTVRGFAAAALDAGIPVSIGQAEQLAAALVGTGRKSPGGGWTLPNWNAVDALAPGFLTAEQLALLQRIEPPASGRFSQNLDDSVDAARRADLPKPPASPPNQPVR